MKLCVLGSGSGGNAILIQSGDTRILIDAGFAARTMGRRLTSIGVDPRSIEAVVITHEHVDHVKGAAAGAARWGWQIYATAGTQVASAPLMRAGTRTLSPGVVSCIGQIEIRTVATSHDAAEPVAVIATGTSSGVNAALVYDLGLVSDRIQSALEGVEILVLESNHDGEMLRNGPYPASLKRRIASRHGHLSNRAAGVAAARCVHRGLSHVLLAHLSETNNTPGVATEAMREALRRTSFRGNIVACAQDRPSATISASRGPAFGAEQLTLSL